jgi:hypothetical protein
LGFCVVTYKRNECGDDKNKMPDSAQGDHHRDELLYVPSAQR